MNHSFSFSRIIQLRDRFKGLGTSGSGAQSLSGRATRSGVWIGGGFVVQRGLQFGSNLILTRLLFPEAFGLMALCSVFVIGLAMFSDLGIKPAIIRDARGSDPIFLNTAWTIQIIRGFMLFLLGSLLAYPISLVYDQPILFPLLTVLCSTALITGFLSVKMATAERDLDFRAVTFVQTAGQISTIFTMVAFAFLWKSVWALAFGNIIGTLTTVITSHLLLRGHHHRLKLDQESAKSLVNFGKWIFLSTIVTYVGGEGLRAIQGGFTTPGEFGVLAIAYTIASIPIELAIKLTSAVGLPALSEAHRADTAAMGRVLHKFRKRVLFLSLILVSFVVLVSEPLIEFLYDQRYHDAGQFVVVIALTSSISLIFAGYNNALLALGKSRTYLWVMSSAAIFRILGLAVGFKIFGIMGMIVGIGIANILVLVIAWCTVLKLSLLDLKLDVVSLSMIFLLGGMCAFIV